MKKILCLVVCAVFAAALPARAQSDEYRDAVAEMMEVHRNTLVYRFEKLQRKFGLDIRAFEDALTFKLAMMVVDYIKYSKNHPS